MNISNEVIKFVAKSLLEVIEKENLLKDEIISTIRLWAKSGWSKPCEKITKRY